MLENYVGNELKTDDLPGDLNGLIKAKDWNYKDVAQPSLNAVWDPTGGDDLRLNTMNLTSMISEPTEAMYDIDDPDKGKVKSLIKVSQISGQIGKAHGR